MHGLTGTEVVADDFVVAGFGDTYEEAVCDHKRNTVAFLQRCSQRGVKLAVKKLQLCLEEVLLISHYATKSGLKVHPEEVPTILEMPRPSYVKSLHCLNGTVQYLAKFLPLSGYGQIHRRKRGTTLKRPSRRHPSYVTTA